MIETQGLTKYFGPKMAVENISFSVEKGEILGFLGPNGAGKTTTMRILTGYLSPTRGEAKVAGFDVFKESMEVRKRIGYLPESVPLYDEMPVESYLNFVAELKGTPDRAVQVGTAIKDCGLSSVRSRIIGNLSKGFQQRVGLAQALIGNPEVLILDEPTTGLDPHQIIEIRNLIRRLGGERTIILSTHILPEVEAICGRVVIINEGRVIAQDTPENLTRRLQGAARVEVHVGEPDVAKTSGLLRSVEEVEKVQALGSSTGGTGQKFLVESRPEVDLRPRVARVLVEAGVPLLGLRQQDLTLEEIFIQTVDLSAAKSSAREVLDE
jgi:ABC-2 type transport system ATP-binding protein